MMPFEWDVRVSSKDHTVTALPSQRESVTARYTTIWGTTATPRRLALHITQAAAAQHFSVWPTAISRIERGISREHDLANRYRTWLDEQPQTSA